VMTILKRTSLSQMRFGYLIFPLILTFIIFLLTWLSNGTLLGGSLNTIGPSLWQFPALFLVQLSAGMGLKVAYDKWGPR
ncbi:MAG: hypothetical protein ACKO3U_06255, partial [Actinomycetota bacterium]